MKCKLLVAEDELIERKVLCISAPAFPDAGRILGVGPNGRGPFRPWRARLRRPGRGRGLQGFAWNVNSFDQEGVQLGKVLAKRVLAHETDGALKVYSDLLNI